MPFHWSKLFPGAEKNSWNCLAAPKPVCMFLLPARSGWLLAECCLIWACLGDACSSGSMTQVIVFWMCLSMSLWQFWSDRAVRSWGTVWRGTCLSVNIKCEDEESQHDIETDKKYEQHLKTLNLFRQTCRKSIWKNKVFCSRVHLSLQKFNWLTPF